jgi:hypothetical protein
MSTVQLRPWPLAAPVRWSRILRSCNARPGERLDPVSRWLVISRACVLPMSLISGPLAAGHLLNVLLARLAG